jgi:hypothetical protein
VEYFPVQGSLKMYRQFYASGPACPLNFSVPLGGRMTSRVENCNCTYRQNRKKGKKKKYTKENMQGWISSNFSRLRLYVKILLFSPSSSTYFPHTCKKWKCGRSGSLSGRNRRPGNINQRFKRLEINLKLHIFAVYRAVIQYSAFVSLEFFSAVVNPVSFLFLFRHTFQREREWRLKEKVTAEQDSLTIVYGQMSRNGTDVFGYAHAEYFIPNYVLIWMLISMDEFPLSSSRVSLGRYGSWVSCLDDFHVCGVKILLIEGTCATKLFNIFF